MLILVVEDDPKIARFLAEGLEAEGHQVDVANDGDAALEAARSRRHALILLDLLLPGGRSGLDLLQEVRAVDPTTPIIVITALDAVEDRVRGLDLGADDYLVKPFSFVELLARVRALFRRADSQLLVRPQVGVLRLDRTRRTAQRVGGKPVELSNREFQLLEFFMKHAGEPQSRARIADQVWGYQFDTGTNVIDVYVNYVRKKLRELELEPIKTLRGIGYVFEPEACAGDPA